MAVRTTEAGDLLLRHADGILDQLSVAEWEIAQLAGLRRDTIRLGSFFSALVSLSSALGALSDESHPEITIVDDLVNRDEAVAKLVRGALDVAVVFEYLEEPAEHVAGVEIVPLFEDPMSVLLPARHRFADRDALDLGELAGETWIRAHAGSAARAVDRLTASAGVRPVTRLAGNGDEPVEAQALVAAGAGIGFAHRLNVVLEPEKVIVKPLRGRPEPRLVQAACRTGDVSPAVRATITALQQIGRLRTERPRPATRESKG
jgi:DNA-binding transcriptional LysR family regulator